jgi:DNA-binding CsgD family transcriptional regulator
VTRQTNTIAMSRCDLGTSPQEAALTADPARRPITTTLARFGAQTAAFTARALGAEWSCFYYIDEEAQPFAFQAHRTPWGVRESYVKHDIAHSDPLHPANLATQNLSFVSVFDRRLNCASQSRRIYWNFLSSFGARDAAEMIFRVRGHAIAGMSLVWVGREGLRADRHLGESVQSYIEFNLTTHYGASPSDRPSESITDLSLTERELEIVQLVCHGLTNARIAQRLSIGLATVKTHLLHVFEKLGVCTRAELVSRCLSALPDPGLR